MLCVKISGKLSWLVNVLKENSKANKKMFRGNNGQCALT